MESHTRAQNVDVEAFIGDPARFFDMSYTAMHSVSREGLSELQRAGIARRFEQHRDSVPMVAKLAGHQGITTVDEIGDCVPLLFEHTMYKSYPLALLERLQFDKLTGWIDKLTRVDLSGIDATGCRSIDSWLWTLFEEADLDVGFSGGTTGTMSFLPWSATDLETKFRSHRVGYLQTFGGPPSHAALNEPYHFITTSQRNRRNYLSELATLGRDGYSHIRGSAGYDADMSWLAARLRLAAASGDASRVRVAESLLARRAELEESHAHEEERERAWGAELDALKGERVLWLAAPFTIQQFAAPRVERGERWSYDADSALLLGGGSKGHQLAPDWRATVERFLDIPTRASYGMMEMSGQFMECVDGRYHVPPWIVPFVLDPDTSELLPRDGVQRGRAAYFDLLPNDHWGGFITGDEIEIDFSAPCMCGATSYHVAPDVARLSDRRGGDDKISCAATPQAHAEAMQFLVGY